MLVVSAAKRVIPRAFRRRPRLTLALVALLTILCALVALRLQPSTGIGTLVSSSSADYGATQVDNREFGAAPVVVLVRLPLTELVRTRDLLPLSELEACLGGQQLKMDGQLGALQVVAPSQAAPYGGSASPCGALMRLRPAKVVYGPGTFLSRAVAAVTSEIHTLSAAAAKTVQAAQASALKLARAKGLSPQQADAAAKEAGELVLERQLGTLSTLADQTGINSTPSIDNPAFLEQIVFGSTAAKSGSGTGSASGSAAREPDARFSYLFPNADSGVIQVRLRAGLTDAQQSRAITLIRQALTMKRFRLPGGSYLLAGEPVVLSDLGAGISQQLLLLLIGAAIVMALVLQAGFRARLRMLPLILALAAAAVTFGLTSLAGAGLTLAGVAVLPILIGLGVDYAVQFQSGTAVRSVAVAALATAAGFLVLLLSPVPMVRGFGLLLVVGVGVALAMVLVAAPAALAASDRTVAGASVARARSYPTRGRARDLWPGTARRSPAAGPRRMPVGTLARHPRTVLAAAAVLAVAGWGLATQTGVQSDITKLVPSSMPALRHLRTLERVTGVSGEIDVVVRAHEVATPSAVAWMVAYERRVLAHFGYSAARGCAHSTLCPALSLPDLFELGSGSAGLTQKQINALLRTVPGYFQRAVITPDRRYATLAFGIRLMPLAQQARVISYLRAQLHPPDGVAASLAGLPVLAADADGSLSSGLRRTLTLVAGLLAVTLVLLAVFRNPKRVLIPLAPIVLATGWSALVIYLLGIPLNPMSATLGALVIAISTEFSVLLAERVRTEHGDGWSLGGAIERAYQSTGTAILVSGVTAIAGFGVLVLSNISMLRDFGFVTLIDMSVSLAGVLLVLPAVITLAQTRPGPKPRPRTLPPARGPQGRPARRTGLPK
jgi:hydrophobe/amphiphile efflux-3 (HAE3) family protein